MKTIVKLCSSEIASLIKICFYEYMSQQVLNRQSNTWLGFLLLGHGTSKAFSLEKLFHTEYNNNNKRESLKTLLLVKDNYYLMNSVFFTFPVQNDFFFLYASSYPPYFRFSISGSLI